MTNLEEKNKKRAIEDDLNLVFFVFNKYFKRQYTYRDDLISCGNLGLVRAYKKYDEGQGVTFSTYACACIKYEMIKFLKREQRFKWVNLTSEEIPTQGIRIEEPIELFFSKDLPNDMREIARLLFEGYTYREVGRKLGVSQTTIFKKVQKLREILK